MRDVTKKELNKIKKIVKKYKYSSLKPFLKIFDLLTNKAWLEEACMLHCEGFIHYDDLISDRKIDRKTLNEAQKEFKEYKERQIELKENEGIREEYLNTCETWFIPTLENPRYIIQHDKGKIVSMIDGEKKAAIWEDTPYYRMKRNEAAALKMYNDINKEYDNILKELTIDIETKAEQ